MVADPEFGFTVARSDRDPTPGQITPRLLRDILAASVVIADLTGRNANVYYELGVVHSFGRPVIILVDSVESLSFDAQNERVIAIGDAGQISVSQAEATKKRLRESLRVVVAPDYTPASLVTEVASAQSLAAIAPHNPVASELEIISSKLDDIMKSSRRRMASPEQADLRSLTDLVFQLARRGELSSANLYGLITPNTSAGFDTWVNRVGEMAGLSPGWGTQDNEESPDL